ncbi:MAG: NADH-quinone oxidoreductase subunit N [Lysobacteraceae bacterium SCN 69-123]|jgi:NADH-quinone oxidoreductase subunit N|uniref:NADH-quinone oxidoreductase subunit N n=1 Tax=Stenotrophomonas acidaminiphila TaxID=128780 RepID=A0A0R0E7K7_9GAMM|nr:MULTISPECIES: NADH-quinone oxidoreductase subunit NuoN [Stenotrophomonas]ODU47611.1 MAG: NADH-quinone oxidoreductase subunit N [Xanthomonadaceae bacterium SCN 69-123]OZB51486.1 MAG: NADH-quinone oxidoreductase subunit N [Stenotrophomonas sp. 14-69-23]ALJ27915.1 NADH dehydrogenase subunit N [Stenotrophomonas acidaminiphila]KRG87362.1 NADH:ubiquinone oxidoreductase subunit N [Stenotrophomonas acidaminiphila]MBN8800179.1 NADH-quinone oxidoreductase subunit NuoN [Stenotrophomonas acidaminiphila
MTTPTLLPLTAADLPPLLPELVVIGGAFALLILDLFISNRHKVWTHFLSVAILAVAFAMLLGGVGGQGEVFHGMFIRDNAADVMKTVVVLVSGLTLIYGWSYLRERNLYQGEIAVLVLFATAGMMLLVSAGSLLMVYLGLELLALCSYALVASNRDNKLAAEAGMKYIVLGSLASGLLLYGMSLVYGATGSLHLDVIHAAAAHSDERVLLLTGAVFMVAGVAFKLGAAPFHMWLPDVYQGAPAPIALFISSAPKLAAFGMAYRLLEAGVGPLSAELQYVLAGLAALSLVVGNLMAIAQVNLKRMLAYSTVSHIGFLLMGVAGGGAAGYSSAMFYAVAYAIMSTAAFGVIVALSRSGFEAESIDDFKGLNARNPWMAGLMLCAMFSLAGIPPFLGFWAKLAVLGAAVNGGLLWLVILGVMSAVVGCFYYLRVVKVMYFDEPVGEPLPRNNDRLLGIVLGVNCVALLVLPVALGPLLAWMRNAFAHLS